MEATTSVAAGFRIHAPVTFETGDDMTVHRGGSTHGRGRRSTRVSLSMAALLAVLTLAVSSSGAAAAGRRDASPIIQLDIGPGGFMSPNVTYVGTIPIDSPGVGARVVKVGDQVRFYVTGVTGLTIYDITDPGLPLPLGHLQLPNWENEDVAVSADGGTVLISEFTGTYMHVIDTSNVLAPVPVGFIPFDAGHIVSCVDKKCDWVYGSEGSIIDLRDKTNPTLLPQGWADQLGLPHNGHNINVDAAGIATADVTPITMMNVKDPQHPKIVAQAIPSEMSENDTAYQHNNLRPRADRYRPRNTAALQRQKGLRPGELVLSNGETNFTGTCEAGSGPFATYSAKNWDRGASLRLLDVFRPISGDYQNGDPAINALGCSGHWFSEENNYVAAAWYEHGTRIMKINPKNGAISQVGYFQPVVGSASAAHWVGEGYVYVVDYERGIDILRFDRNGPTPTTAEFDASWLAKLGTVDPVSEQARYLCSFPYRSQS